MKSLRGAMVAVSLTACSVWVYRIPAAPSAASRGTHPDASLRAAPILVDITPPVGLSKFGFGLEGRLGTGVMTHLYCRGFRFEMHDEGFAWLACDLGAMSTVLQHRVAEISRTTLGDVLGTDRIFLSATHTHAGPAHFFGEAAYTGGEGGSRAPGYDQRVVDFLALRIARAIHEAAGRLEPATVRTTVVQNVHGISRNRAMGARVNDPDVQTDCAGATPCLDPAHLNVNRALTLVRVDTATVNPHPLGLMAVFAVHPTAMGTREELYHGDLFAFATRYCDDALNPRNGPFVCALANGAEGDVSPDWSFQAESEARRLGERLGLYMVRGFNALETAPSDPPALEARYRELVLPGARVDPGNPAAALCDWAELGTPGAGGAMDGPTRLRILEQFNEGIIDPRRVGCAAPRIAVTGLVPDTVSESRDGYFFPARVPMEWFRVGNMAFAAVPGEPTTATGEMIAGRVPQNPNGWPGAAYTTTVGLTNGYVDYFATAPEYVLQDYEGASTVYGPATAAFLAARMHELATTAVPAPNANADAGATPPTGATTAFVAAASECPPWDGGSVHPNPDVLRDDAGVTQQPDLGQVGDLHFSPEADLVRPRWPAGLRADHACWNEASHAPGPFLASVFVRPGRGGPRSTLSGGPTTWEWFHGAPSVVVGWDAPPETPLCGASVATLIEDANGFPQVARACRDAVPTGDPGDLDPWNRQPPHLCPLNGQGPPVDDEHAMVSVWYGYGEVSPRWHARFQLPCARWVHLTDGKYEVRFAFEIRMPGNTVVPSDWSLPFKDHPEFAAWRRRCEP